MWAFRSQEILLLLLMLSSSCCHSILGIKSDVDEELMLPRELQTETGWNQIGQDITGLAERDQFGWAVAISDSGNRIVVAGPNNDRPEGADSGEVRIFELDGNNQWTLLGSSIIGEVGSAAGMAVAMSGDGNTVAIGSYRVFPYRGSTRIYRYEGNTWRQLVELRGISDRDRFGGSMSLNRDGTRIAIGAAYHDGEETIRGHALIYEQDLGNDEVWQIMTNGDIDGVNEGDRFGHAVAMSSDGTTVAIGAIGADPSGLSNAGTVTVYERISSLDGWVQMGDIIAGTGPGDQSGYSVSLSADGSMVAIGSPLYSGDAITNSGMVRVFNWTIETGEWDQIGEDILPEEPVAASKFGQSVSLSSDGVVLAVGEPNDGGIGKTSIYQYDLNAWSRDITLEEGAATDRFGYSVALNGQATRVIVGAYNADSTNGIDSGISRVYEFQTSDWILEVDRFQAFFGTGNTPEFTIIYEGDTPSAATGRTYAMTMYGPGCLFEATGDTTILPVAPTGPIPDTETFSLATQLDVNTDTISSSTNYYAETPALGLGTAQLAFCVQMEILDATGDQKVERFADVVVQLDMGQGFLAKDFVTRDGGTQRTDIREATQFQYDFNTFYCDEFGTNITEGGTAVAPGGEVSVCLEAADGEPVMVVDVKSVSFENFLAPLLGVELIDDLGRPVDGTTVKDCSLNDGTMCRIAAITVPRLYEYVDSSGIERDVTPGVSMEGIVVFKFPSQRGRGRHLQESAESLETTFRIMIDLAEPPDRRGRGSSQGPPYRVSPVLQLSAWVGSTALGTVLFQ